MEQTKTDMCAADAILTSSWQPFLAALSTPTSLQSAEQEDARPLVIASLIERLLQEPPRNWGEEQRENLNYAIRVRYTRLNSRIPPAIESAMFLVDLLDSPDSRLARLVQRTGSRGTASLDACKEMLGGAETRDISYPQIANALLFMVASQNGDPYDPSVFVEGLRQHRAGPKIDWTDVVQGFDKEQFRPTKSQFLALYNALLPLAREYANFDIQSLWGGQWQHSETQLDFVYAFVSTSSQELDVSQIPDLRRVFDMEDYIGAIESSRVFATEAIKHPLVSRDAIEALFTIVFRSQDAYNHAQQLGIPDDLINPTMPIFVSAASAVPKPWSALQEQAMKQLIHPFLLKQHRAYHFVMQTVWAHDEHWLAAKMVELYNTEGQMRLPLIYEHAVEQGWIPYLLTLSNEFAVDLATYAHGKERCNLEDWAQSHINIMGPLAFARAIVAFLRGKLDDEAAVQRENTSPKTAPLAIKTVHLLLLLVSDAASDEDTGPIFRQCLQAYPRLFIYNEDGSRDSFVEPTTERGHLLSDEASSSMEERYKDMYGGKTNPEQLVSELKRLKTSDKPADADLFAAMLHGLFEEYNCFGEYPNEALATTAVLFGGLIQFNVLSGIAEQAAIFMIFEAVSEYGPDDPMYRFGLQAMIHLLGRLKEWPQLAERILHTPSLQGTQAIGAAETVLRELQQESMNADGANGITNGVLEDDSTEDPPILPFLSINVEPPLRPDLYEDPDEDVSDKVMFALNNVSKRNLEEKFKDLNSALEEKHHQWFARYLVEELAKTQLNFQDLYLQLLETFDKKILWQEVLRETYISCAKMLNAKSTMASPSERATLKNLAHWLGSLTLARNQPIFHRSISFKDLLIEGHETSRLLVVLPFTCKTLVHAGKSKVFRPPNPWITELLGLLSELYHFVDMKMNSKFEIEGCCTAFGLNVKEIEPLDTIRNLPLLHENNLLQQYVPDGGADGFGDMHIMSLSKRAPNERFSPEAVVQALPDLGGMLQIPQAAGNVTQPQLRNIFVTAAQTAIYEIIAPVVERSVTIAAISTAELIQKDFATEVDVDKTRNSAHTVVKALSGSLALVTCKEPLRMSITNNIRILASRNLQDQLPEGQIIMFVNDNIDTVCGLVERAAEEHSLAEIDAQLAGAMEDRRRHTSERPNESFNNPPVSRWSQMIPEPFRQDPNGLNRQQLALYEDFGRQARITPAQHSNNQSQDSNRQLPDVLSDSFLPSLPTPAEAPAMPRPTPQQQRMQPVQGQHAQGQVNGYINSPNIGRRVLELLEALQQAAREAPEEHIGDINEGAPIRGIFEELYATVNGAGVQKDSLALVTGQSCFFAIFSKEVRKRLEIEVFVRLLKQLCNISVSAGRQVSVELAAREDDSIFSAGVVVSMLQEEMFDTQHVDGVISRALRARRHVVLGFLKELLEETLLSENSMVLRSDFVLTYEALLQWLSEEPNLESGREIVSKLQIPVNQANGMPSPPQTEKQDQLEYIFEEWIRLQRKDTPERSLLAFVRQLHANHITTDAKDAIAFIRACIEMSCMYFERLTAAPWSTQDAPYTQIDALGKLIACMVAYQAPVDGEPQTNKANSLEAIVRLVILVMNEHHNKQRERWNAKVYFRLFSTLLCELRDLRQYFGQQQELEIARLMGLALQVMQPRYFPGFTYCWLALLSHRLLIPAFLGGAGRNNGGWDNFTKLLRTLLTNLDEMLAVNDGPVMQDFYRGVMRVLLVIHHDFPGYLIENHLQLNSSIPLFCHQLHNIINSTVSRAIIHDQPDPFTPGLKINRLEQVRQTPAIHADLDKILEDVHLKGPLESICQSSELDTGEVAIVASTIENLPSTAATRLALNALVLYIGVHNTKTSNAFSAAATSARLLERLLSVTLAPEARYHLVSAMANQVRYVNAHTHYFSTALQHFFVTSSEEVQEVIMRILFERLSVPRPHPWGLIVMVLELLKNPAVDVWNLPWMKTAPQVESMLAGLAHSQERMGRSPLAQNA